MEDQDFRMERQAYLNARNERLFIFAFLATLTAVPVTTILTYEKLAAKKASQLKEQSPTETSDKKMLKAAYEGNTENFDQALKDGANFNAVNREGQNVLMVSLSNKLGNSDFDVAFHILNNPELAQKIDYKQVDDNGCTVMDLINNKIASKSTERLQAIKKMTYKNLRQQKEEEAVGKIRSSTSYAFFEQYTINK